MTTNVFWFILSSYLSASNIAHIAFFVFLKKRERHSSVFLKRNFAVFANEYSIPMVKAVLVSCQHNKLTVITIILTFVSYSWFYLNLEIWVKGQMREVLA